MEHILATIKQQISNIITDICIQNIKQGTIEELNNSFVRKNA